MLDQFKAQGEKDICQMNLKVNRTKSNNKYAKKPST